MRKKKIFTLTSTALYALPVIPLVAFSFFGTIASITEFPSNRSGVIYIASSTISIILIILIPFFIILCNIITISCQIVAIVRKEILWLNILLIVVSLVVIALSVLFIHKFWQGAMSV